MSARSRYWLPNSDMCRFLPCRSSPSSRSNTCAVLSTSSGITRIRRRVSGFMVVSHIMSGSFSPRPLERFMLALFVPISSRILAFSRSE